MAPMAGFTDLAFRRIALSHQADIVYTEMISAKAVIYRNEKTLKMLDMGQDREKTAVQIFGRDPKEMGEAANYISFNYKPLIIDINMGCPVSKVVKNNGGSSLLKNPDLIEEIVREVRKNTDSLLSVKIRIGWDENHINGIQVAKAIERGGADFIIVHGRTRSSFYSGEVNYDFVRKIRDSVNIPVVLNGDITKVKDALSFLKEFPGIMIGREALKNPWIFEDIKVGKERIKKYPEIRDLILKHISYLKEYKKEGEIVNIIKGHIAYYLKSVSQAKSLKVKIFKMTNLDDIIKTLKEFEEDK